MRVNDDPKSQSLNSQWLGPRRRQSMLVKLKSPWTTPMLCKSFTPVIAWHTNWMISEHAKSPSRILNKSHMLLSSHSCTRCK